MIFGLYISCMSITFLFTYFVEAFFPLTMNVNPEALRLVFLLAHRRRTSLSRSATSGMFPPPSTRQDRTYIGIKFMNYRLRRFDTFTSNLLTIPSVTIGLVTAITIVTISEKVNDRSIVAMAMDLWVLPFLVALYWLPEGVNPWMTYVRLSVNL